MHDAPEMLSRALDLIDLVRRVDKTVEGQRCLEIGTGWFPWLPILLVLHGASHVTTLDVNPWLSYSTAVLTTREARRYARRIAEAADVPERDVHARLDRASRAANLAEWQSALGIRYLRTTLAAVALPDASIDMIFSSNVLEHVRPDALRAMHNDSARLLRDRGLIVHRLNPQDHFSEDDRSITGAHFLKFSARQWYWIGGSGLAYHNRLRCPEHIDYIAQAAFDILHSHSRADDRARRTIESGQLTVHSDYKAFDIRGLTDDYLWVVAQKSDRCRRHANIADQPSG